MPNPEPIVPPARIALLGLGRMGLPMGTNLHRAGFEVIGFDPVAAAREAFAAAGGTSVASARDAVVDAQAVITMLPDGKMVRAALLDGDTCLADLLRPGTLVIDMSSSAPVGTGELARDLGSRGLALIDAPVSGGVRRAVDGSLAAMVGGKSEDIERARGLLAAMSASIFVTGGIGSGHAMKALNNYVSAVGLVAACEAVRIGGRFGLDPQIMVDILNVSTGRNNSTETKMKPFVLSGSYAAGFSLGLMAKDLRTAQELAEHLGVHAPMADACADLWAAAMEEMGGAADHTEIDRYLGSSRRAG
jgi:3-hydroxyisobutyrate dehydrogenase